MFGGNKLAPRIAALTAQVDAAQAQLAAISRSNAMIRFAPDGTVLAVNQNFLDTMGYQNADQLIGRKHALFCEPSYVESPDYARFWQQLRNGEFNRRRVRRRNANGATVWLEATYSPVVDKDGKVVEVIKLATDVTAAVEKEARNQATLTAIHSAMAAIEFLPSGEVIHANENFLKTMGYRLEDIVGKHHRMFCAPAIAQSPEYRQMWEALGAGRRWSGRYSRVARDGHEVWLEASYTPVRDEAGHVTAVVKFATEITEQVQQQKAGAEAADFAHAASVDAQRHSDEGVSSITRSRAAMTTMAADIESAVAQVKQLGQSSERITSIVNTIREIADQTNLLALNAAIEAARAGDSGRGFAVVADEVRKLAERTALSTTDIGRMVDNIKSQTSSAVASMDEIMAQTRVGVQWIEATGDTMQQIRDVARSVVAATENLHRVKD